MDRNYKTPAKDPWVFHWKGNAFDSFKDPKIESSVSKLKNYVWQPVPFVEET